jgi:hypothetical protein
MAQSTTWSHSEVEGRPASSAPPGRRRDIEHDTGPLFFLLTLTAMPISLGFIIWLALMMH